MLIQIGIQCRVGRIAGKTLAREFLPALELAVGSER